MSRGPFPFDRQRGLVLAPQTVDGEAYPLDAKLGRVKLRAEERQRVLPLA